VQPAVPSEPGGRPIFKVQIAASSQQLPTDHEVFKGVQNVDVYVENDLFKYTVGATPDFEEISQLRKTVSEQFPQAFIIAFRDGEKIALAQAIREYKNAKQKIK
jgi:N-acetylmuramoyl-L-alanine amidase